MKRVTGIGGIFFKGQRPQGSLFPADTKHFAPSGAPFMVHYRVADPHALLAALRSEGVHVEEKVDESEYGKFGWVVDPEGNKIELWQPLDGQ